MAPFSWSRWLRSLFRPRVTTVRRRQRQPAVESLETRLAPATFTWSGGGKDSNWSTPANWVGNKAPSVSDGPAVDDLFFPAVTSPGTPTDDIVGLNINSLTLSGGGYTLASANGAQLTLGSPTVSGSGSLTVNGGVSDIIALDLVMNAPGGGGSLQQFLTVNSNSTLALQGKLIGTTDVNLTKEGTGTLILSGDGSGFVGPFTVDNSGGVVRIQNGTALGAGQVTVGLNSQIQVDGSLAVSPATGIKVANALILNGVGPDGLGALVSFAGNNTWTGNIQLDGNTISTVTVGSDAGSTLSITGNISDLGPGHSLIKEGPGTVALSGNNSYRLGTVVNNGVLDVQSDTALGFTDGTTATGVVVNSTIAEKGTLQLDQTPPATANGVGTDITISDVVVTLNGAGFNPGTGSLGALFNASGNNTWAGDIILGSAAPYGSNVVIDVAETASLKVTGVAGAAVGTPAVTSPNSNFSLTKTDVGTLIFTTANNYTGQTVIANGILEIEDSQALGALTAGTVIQNGATLELAVDDRVASGTVDSITGNTAGMIVSEPLTVIGDGFGGLGALYSHDGINRYAGNVALGSVLVPLGSVGVDPASNPTGAPYNYDITPGGVVLDDSLTISGVISGGTTFDKFGSGQLVLPGANTYTGTTNIDAGWVTIEDPHAFGVRIAGEGDAAQPPVNVAAGAAIHMLPLNGSMTLPYNLNLTGNGVSSAYPLVNQKGALMSLAGINQVSGNVGLGGPVGIGVEQIYSTDPLTAPQNVNFSPNAASQLTLTGQQIQIPPDLVLDVSSTRTAESDQYLTIPGITGLLTLNANALNIPNDFRIYAGDFTNNPSQATLLYDSTTNGDFTNPTNTGTATVTVNLSLTSAAVTGAATGTGANWNTGGPVAGFGPLTSGLVEIIVNQGGSKQPKTQWSYTAFAAPSTTVSGGITKLGSQRLIVQGPGDFTGPVDIQQGVLLDQNSTGLGANIPGTGAGANTTTVEAGAALELANDTLAENGGLQGGIEVWGENLVLLGTGNAAFGDSPLTVLSGTTGIAPPIATTIIPADSMWRGPVLLTNSFNLNLPGAVGNSTQFTLTFNGAATTPINYSGVAATDAMAIASALSGLAAVKTAGASVAVIPTAGGFTITLGGGLIGTAQALTGTVLNSTPGAVSVSTVSSGVVTVQPGSRLNIFGTVDDSSGAKAPPAPSDLHITGGGEVALDAANTYRGVTSVDAGVLSVLNSQALGATGAPQVDTLTLTTLGTGTTINLTFNGVTTATPVPITGTAATDAAAITAALMGLNTVSGLGGTVNVTPGATPGTFTITFGGGLAGFVQNLSASIAPGGVGSVSVNTVTPGTGGTIVANGASLSLQGNLSVAGEPIQVQGAGVSTAPGVPQQWFPVGPAPVLQSGQTDGGLSAAGRVTSIAIDTSGGVPFAPTANPPTGTAYITTSGGGAWKTIDGGTTWVPLFDGFAGMYAGAIAVAPSDPRVLYLGTGEADNSGDSFYGTGIYKSTDSGHTWALLTNADASNPLFGQAVSKIVVDPFNANLIYAATSDLATNAPQSGMQPPGVWRYNGSTWFNLTSQVSFNRNPVNNAAAPNPPTAGPDDDFRVSFPQSKATWSDLQLTWYIDTLGALHETIYAALGTVNGNGANNAVFRCSNPATGAPVWNMGNAAVNGQATGEFPAQNNGGALNGNIKLGVWDDKAPAVGQAGDVLYAAVANPVTGNLMAIEQSVNGGVTWTALTNLPSGPPDYLNGQGMYASAIVVNQSQASAGQIVYVAGNSAGGAATPFADQVWFNNSGGAAAWSDISTGSPSTGVGPHPLAHALALDSQGNVLLGTDGGVFRYDAVAKTWSSANGDLNTVSFNAIAVDPNNLQSIFGAAQNNGVLQFMGSAGWTYDGGGKNGAINVSPTAVAINPNNPSLVYNVNGGQLWVSQQGGQAGSWVAVPISGGNFPLVLDSVNPSRVVVGGANLWESTTGGLTAGSFISLNSPIAVSAIGLAAYQGPYQLDSKNYPTLPDKGANTYDPNTIYVTNGSQIWLTKDHGQTWVNRTTNLTTFAPTITIQSLTVDPTKRDTVYAVSSAGVGYGKGRVFVSNNAGQSWANITHNLPDVPVWQLVTDPRNGTLYIATDVGVYSLVAGGGTWVRVGVGMPDVRVSQLVLNEGNNTLTAATYGRGVFQLFLETTTANGGAIRAPAGTSALTGRVFLTGPTTFGADGTQALRNGLATAQVNFLATIADGTPGGNYYVTKTGAGNVVFSGANTYGGVTEVQQGALLVHNPQALGGTTNGTLVDNGAALQLESSVTTNEPLTLNGTGPAPGFDGHATGALENLSNNNSYAGPITLATSSTIGVDSGSVLTVTGSIGDNGNNAQLTKELTGILVLTGADTYGGNTTVSQGVLNIQNSAALGTNNATTTVVDGAQLQLQGGLNVTGESLDLTGTGIFNTGALESVGGANVWAGNVALDQVPGKAPPTNPGTAVNIGVLYLAPGDLLTLTGPVSQPAALGSTAMGITKVGLGTLVLDNADTYKGVTNVNAGTLRIQQGQALGTPTNGTVVANGAALEVDGDPTGIGNNTGITVPGEPLALNGTGAADVQVITVNGTSGTFTLSFNGSPPTASLPFNATALQVQNALNGLIGPNAVTVTQSGGLGSNVYLVIFTGAAVSAADQSAIVANGTGGTIATASTIRHGAQGALSNLSGANVWSGPVTLQSSSSVGTAANTSLTVSGVVGDVATPSVPPPTLSKVGTGTAVLTNANTYAGLTSVSAGILNVRNNFALGTPVNEVQTITVTGTVSGLFWLQFQNPTSPMARSLSGNTGTTTATMVANTINQLLTDLHIAGTVGVTQSGNVYTVTYNGGAVAGMHVLPQLVAFGSGGTQAVATTVRDGSYGTAVLAGATLQVQGGITVANEPLTITGAGFTNLGALDSPSGNNLWDGPITLAGPSSVGSDTDPILGTSTLSIDKVIGQSVSNSTLTKVGTGIVNLDGSASNTYTGLTTVANGTLELANTNGTFAVPAGLTVGTGGLAPGSAVAILEASNEINTSPNQALTVNSDGLFDLNGNTQSVASLTMTGGTVELIGQASQLTVTGGVTATSDAATPANPALLTGPGTLALTSNSVAINPNVTVTGSGLPSSAPNMVIASPITSTATNGFTKAGNGVLQVTSNNNTLPVTVSAGTLLADANATPTIPETLGAVTLAGGTIAGHGAVVSITPQLGTGGTIQPAEDSGTPTVLTTTTTAPQSWNPNTTLSLVLNDAVAGDYSVMSLNGDITLGSAKLAGFAGLGVHLGDTFTVLTTTGTRYGTFASTQTDPVNNEPEVFVGGEKFDAVYTQHTVVLTRTQAVATISETSAPNPSFYGQDVMVTATVMPEAGGGAIPTTDTVTFTLDGTVSTQVATTPVAGTNKAIAVFDPITYTHRALTVGSHTITAVFNGDNTFAPTDPAHPASVTQTVKQSATQFTLGTSVATVTGSFTLDAPLGTDPLGTTGRITRTDGVTWDSQGYAAGQEVNISGTVNGQFVVTGTAGSGSVLLVSNGGVNFTHQAAAPLTVVGVFVPSQPVTIVATFSPSGGGVGVPTGIATFTVDGGAPVGATLPDGTPVSSTGSTAGQVTLLPNGQALIVLNNLSVSQHRIRVKYLGDTNFASVMSSTDFLVNVIKGRAIIGIAANPLSSFYGANVAFTATVSGPVTPGGTATFYKDQLTTNNIIGTSPLDATGQATINYNLLNAGSHTIYVSYSGNISYNSGTASVPFNVSQAATQTTISSSADTTAYGQPLTLTATVGVLPPGGGPLAGTVTFFDITGATPVQLGNPAVVAPNGVATLVFTTLGVGMHTVSATYNGNFNLHNSVSTNTLSQNVQVGVIVTPTSNVINNIAVWGQAVTLSATVKGVAPGNPVPPDGESVTFTDTSNGNTLGTAMLSHGVAVLSPAVTGLSVGPHVIQASYAGDAPGGSFLANVGTFTLTVNKDSTTTRVTGPGGTPTYGTDLTFTVTVSPNSPGSGTPSGTVGLYDGPPANGKLLGTATLSGGTATVDTSLMLLSATVGNGLPPHTVYAAYMDDADFSPSSGSTTQAVAKDNSTTTLSESSQGSATGSAFYSVPVTLTATVTANLNGNPVTAGSVTFSDSVGGRTLGTVGVNASGVAMLTVSNLSVGNHTLVATYGTSVNFNTSHSGNVPLAVAPDSTSTTVSTSITPSYVGQAVVFSATVTAGVTNAAVPTGTVQFWDGPAGTGTLLGNGIATGGGVWTLSTSRLAFGHGTASGANPGGHTITAVYLTNTNFTTSQNTVNQDVLYNDSIKVSSSLAGPVYGQDFTFTATVTAVGTPVPSGNFAGTVTFYDNGRVLGTALASNNPVSVAGSGTSITATLANSALLTPLTATVGLPSHTITATFTADPVNSDFVTKGPSAALSQAVGKDATTTALTTSLGNTVGGPLTPFFYGEALTFSATVTSNAPGSGTPTGKVNFYDGSTLIGYGTLDNTGTAVFPNPNFANFNLAVLPASHVITAQYQGDTNFLVSGQKSNPVTVQVTQASTSITLTATPSDVTPQSTTTQYSQAITFVATVTTLAPGGGNPAGSVSFTDFNGSAFSGTVGSGPVTLVPVPGSSNSSTATWVVSTLQVTTGVTGPHQILAGYGGNTNFAGSNTHPAGDWTVNVNPADTTVSVTSSANPSFVGQGVTFYATVAPVNGVGAPTGNVLFFLDGSSTPFATAKLNNRGVATTTYFVTNPLSAGTHSITASYAGDGNFNPNNDLVPLSQTVNTQALAKLVAPQTINNAPVGTPITFQVVGQDAAGNQDYSANGSLKVIVLSGPAPAGGMFTMTNGIANVSLTLSKAGSYLLLLDATDPFGNEVTTLVTINTHGRQT